MITHFEKIDKMYIKTAKNLDISIEYDYKVIASTVNRSLINNNTEEKNYDI
jgi:hypothetical protein